MNVDKGKIATAFLTNQAFVTLATVAAVGGAAYWFLFRKKPENKDKYGRPRSEFERLTAPVGDLIEKVAQPLAPGDPKKQQKETRDVGDQLVGLFKPGDRALDDLFSGELFEGLDWNPFN